jgi:hypothetical protein
VPCPLVEKIKKSYDRTWKFQFDVQIIHIVMSMYWLDVGDNMHVHDVTRKLSYPLQEQGVTFEKVIIVNF